MKTKQRVLALAFITSVLSGCTNYQYVSLQSNLPKHETTGSYYIADEKVMIEFDFRALNFPVKSYISNISDSSVYLDLTSSVFIENERIMNNAVGNTTISTQGYMVHYEGSSDIYLSGSISNSAQFIHIPPNTYKVLESKPFSAGYYEQLPFYSDYESISSEKRTFSVKRHPFFGTGSKYGILYRFSPNKDGTDYWDVLAEFSESHVYTSDMPPSKFPKYTADTYVVSATNGGGGVIAFFLMVGLVLLAAGDAAGDAGE